MVKFINKLTGNTMWVADDRKEEYLAAGHSIAVTRKAVLVDEPKEKPETKPRTRKK